MAETHRDDASHVDPERRVADLLGVLETARRLAALTELAPLRAMVEQATRRLLDCEQATLLLHDPLCDEHEGRATSEAGEALRRKVVINSSDPSHDVRLHSALESRYIAGARSALACPVVASDDTALGFLLAIDARRPRFDEWDEVVGRALAAQAGAAIHRHALGNPDRVRRFELDLDYARRIQEALLPRHPPSLEGYDIFGWCQPVDETGGDFFDFQDRGAGCLAVAVGDVSGHGFGPALVVAQCRAFLRATLMQTDDPARVISQVNQLVCHDHLEDRFVTAFFGILRRERHRLDYVSAGQGPILFFSRSASTINELEIQGFPLGLAPDLSFGPPAGVEFAPGDFLALITDGFFEWFNPQGECYGVERMKAQIDRDRDQPASVIIRRLHDSVLDFAGGTPQPDDLTAVVIKRLR